jgi:plastocyanin
MLQKSYYIVLAGLLALAVFVSCSSSDNPMTPAPNTVSIRDNSFNPPTINVVVGRVVVWRNDGNSSHTVTSGSPTSHPGAVFDSGTLGRNAGFQFTFTQPGQYPYFCRIHGAGMSGMVVVQ